MARANQEVQARSGESPRRRRASLTREVAERSGLGLAVLLMGTGDQRENDRVDGGLLPIPLAGSRAPDRAAREYSRMSASIDGHLFQAVTDPGNLI
jgi:hypothetical protein